MKMQYIRQICDLQSTAWRLPYDVPSDISVEAGDTTFALHKFPLVSRSGRIRKQLAESKDSSKVHLQDMPGGAEAFELAAKFCYGANLEITAFNVAMLRCAASYLEMSDHYGGDGNLESHTETYLNEIFCHNPHDTVRVLHSCENENLLSFAEDLNIISRCIEGIITSACKEQLSAGMSREQYSGSTHMEDMGRFILLQPQPEVKTPSWWGKELTILNIHMFQRVVTAMNSKGLGQEIINGALMHYATNSLEAYTNMSTALFDVPKGIFIGTRAINGEVKGRSKLKSSTMEEREKRSVVESVVSLLPARTAKTTGVTPVSFLSWLLRAAMVLNATASCRAELEKRFARRLDQATVEDILIPSFYANGDKWHTMYDTDVVMRIVASFFKQSSEEAEEEESDVEFDAAGLVNYESDGIGSPDQPNAMVKVCNLVDAYLAEVAADSNLSVARFMHLAKAVPDHARLLDDGLYKAIDVYLKAHPTIKDTQRKQLCKLLDCQKLSHEACTEAAQNERLCIHLAVQVLYFEQRRLRSAISGEQHAQQYPPQRLSSEVPSAAILPPDNYASVRRENMELKLEVARMRMRLTDLEKNHNFMKQELLKYTPTNKFLNSFSKKLGKLHKLFRSKDSSSNNPLMLNADHNNNTHLITRRIRDSIS